MYTFKIGRIAVFIAGCSLVLTAPAVAFEERLEDTLVHIQLGDDRACGFIVEMDGQNYVVTSAKQVSGYSRMTFKTLFGEVLKPVKVELSLHRDMARFLVDSAEGFKTTPPVEQDEMVEMLEYVSRSGDINPLSLTVSEIADHYFVIEPVAKNPLYGAPVFDVMGKVLGVASVEKSYMIRYEAWLDTVRQKVYPFEGAQWQAVNWKQYNSRYGGLLKEADAFRNELYELTEHWTERPTIKIGITDEMDLEVKRWVKQHNGMINSLQSARKMSSSTNSGDRFRVVRKVYKDSGYGLIEMARKKASTLEFLAEDKNALPYLKEECRRLSFELKIYMIYVRDHLKKSGNMRW